MAEEEVVVTTLTPKEVVPSNIGKMVLEPFNHAIAAGMREALRSGIQAHEVVELLLNQLTSVVGMIEPAGARELTVKAIVEHISPMVSTYVQKRSTSPGGVILPNGATP